MNKWIKLKDKKPLQDKWVYVSDLKKVAIAMAYALTDKDEIVWAQVDNDNNFIDTKEIMYWCELRYPKLPKEKQ